ncbi:MAG: adenylate/guanylate cyclase domain-containing protein [Elusimicrobia bacterium]|nr:adenylate/guanylate cyclase domain-containing protein [Elusimicrobiota bacterium]
MKLKGRGILFWFLGPTSALLFSIAYLMMGWGQRLENVWSDLLFRLRGPLETTNSKIVLVTIDDISLARYGRFPWPRSYHARLIRRLTALGVQTIAFDVMFVDPDQFGAQGDRELERATRESARTVHGFFLNRYRKKLIQSGGGVGQEQFVYEMQKPIGKLPEWSAGLGYYNVEDFVDADGSLRRLALWKKIPDLGTMSLFSVAALAHYSGISREEIPRTWPVEIGINYRGRRFYYSIPYSQVLDGKLSAREKKLLQGALVLVGSVTIGAYDHYPSPFEAQIPGVDIHATLIDNLMRGDYLRFLPLWTGVLAIWGLGLLFYFLAFLPLGLGWAALFSIIFCYSASQVGLFFHQIRLAYVAPVAALAAPSVLWLAYRTFVVEREKRWIRKTFSHYLSSKVIDALMADPRKLRLGGERREMTVFFLDIVNFTALSERMPPEKLTHFLNTYLSRLTEVVLRHDGVVDKYMGDAIMAFWNAPLDQPDHAALACLAALGALAELEGLRKELTEFGEQAPTVRIGLNTGQMVVGNMGSEARFEYTVIGDHVNMASRLEGANKFFGTNILISEATYQRARERVEAREVGSVRVLGKQLPVKVYELFAEKGKLSPDWQVAFQEYRLGVEAFRGRRFGEALEHFHRIRQRLPQDHLTACYTQLCEDYLKVPPAEDWDAVFSLAAK